MLRRCCASLVMLMLLAPAAFADSAADPLARFGWLRELAGSCWRGEHPGGRMVDTQCYDTQYGRFLRGTIRLMAVDGSQETPRLEGDSVFSWDEKSGTIALYTWADNGAIVPGEARLEGERIQFLDPAREGRAPTRSIWARLDANSFQVIREKQEGQKWIETVRVVYRRVDGEGAR